ncbi:hypothetical protein UPYG_G00268870 [Umbra pygmaea]|uniref:Uncharacterized protein n=1 Tax=Umbra pygmaea TaxID=75934 RepID=A0ABD0WFJ5_UMBPY
MGQSRTHYTQMVLSRTWRSSGSSSEARARKSHFMGDGSAGGRWAPVYSGICKRLLRGSARHCYIFGPLRLCSTRGGGFNAALTEPRRERGRV